MALQILPQPQWVFNGRGAGTPGPRSGGRRAADRRASRGTGPVQEGCDGALQPDDTQRSCLATRSDLLAAGTETSATQSDLAESDGSTQLSATSASTNKVDGLAARLEACLGLEDAGECGRWLCGWQREPDVFAQSQCILSL